MGLQACLGIFKWDIPISHFLTQYLTLWTLENCIKIWNRYASHGKRSKYNTLSFSGVDADWQWHSRVRNTPVNVICQYAIHHIYQQHQRRGMYLFPRTAFFGFVYKPTYEPAGLSGDIQVRYPYISHFNMISCTWTLENWVRIWNKYWLMDRCERNIPSHSWWVEHTVSKYY